MENEADFENTPGINIADDSGDLADATTRRCGRSAGGHLLSVLTVAVPLRSDRLLATGVPTQSQ